MVNYVTSLQHPEPNSVALTMDALRSCETSNKQDTLISVNNQKTPPSYITFLKDKRNDSTIFQNGVL
jgi:hypothetical protein